MHQFSSNKVIINLNPNYQKSRQNYVSGQEERLAELILDRVQKYESYVQNSDRTDPEERYADIKRHDSIHVDGARGLGKTTIIRFLSQVEDCNYCKELNKKIYFLPLIDPNQLDKDTNIIDTVTDLMYQEINKSYEEDKFNGNKKELFDKIRDLKCKIDELTYRTYTKRYTDSQTKAKATKDERRLDYTFHLFAEKSCKLLGKKALVLPLDDIDMRLDIGIIILETIRKYFQTPYLIPVIALDSKQAYALIKKDYFENFDYPAYTPNSEISSDSGMIFLKKLPSEYLEKILPPSQRVVLYDMLDYYKHKRDSIYFVKKLDDNREMELSFKELLRLIMNVLFGYKDETDSYSHNDYHIINYLQNKSFRSFMDDARALMRGLKKTDKTDRYRLNTSRLKNRFQIQSKNRAYDQYDGALWFWDKYIERVYKEIEKVSKKDEIYKIDYITLDFLREILIIDAYDTGGLGRKEKIYYRLLLQEFFIKNIFVEFSTGKDSTEDEILKIEKRYNMTGYIEFLMRTLFPAYLFEILVNKKLISLMKFPLEQLKYFALKNVKRELVDLYDEWIPFWTELYQYENDKGDYRYNNPLAIEIPQEDTQPFRKDILYFTTQEIFEEGVQKYYLHPFKILTFAAEYYPSNGDDFYSKYMPKGYLNLKRGSLLSLKNAMKNIIGKENAPLDILSQNLMINIIDSIDIVERFVKNILLVTLNKLQKIHDELYEQLDRVYKLDRKSINMLYKVELRKNISSSMAILLNILLEIVLSHSKYSQPGGNGQNNIKYDINISYIKSSVSETSILLPLITDDPFLRNLKLLWQSNMSESKDLIRYIRVLFQASNLDRVCYADDKRILNLFKKDEIFYPTSIKEAIMNMVVKKHELDVRNAYIKLFCSHLSVMGKKGCVKKIFLNIKNKFGSFYKFTIELGHLNISRKKSYDDMIQELEDIKKRYNKEKKYIERNVTILLIDVIKEVPKFIDELMLYCYPETVNTDAS